MKRGRSLLKRNEVVKLENEIVVFEMSRYDHTIGIVYSLERTIQ
jgi:hypothetical protein